MANKAYSTKTSEYRTYSTKGTFDDIKDFESMKTEMLPAKYGSLVQANGSAPVNNKEFYYEYKEEKNPKGTFDRKDLHTVEQYEFQSTPKNNYSLPAITSTPTKTVITKSELSHNIDELDSLLDDLQRDRERKQYKSGYASDTMESSSFDYRSTSTPIKSGYSSLSKMETNTEYIPVSPAITREINKEIIKNEFTESRLVPIGTDRSNTIATNNYNYTTSSSNVPMKKVTTTVKTYTYEVPVDQDPTLYPIPGTTPPNTYIDRSFIKETTDYNETGARERRGRIHDSSKDTTIRTLTHYPNENVVTRTVHSTDQYGTTDKYKSTDITDTRSAPYGGYPPNSSTSYKVLESNYTYSTTDGGHHIEDKTPPFPSSPVPFPRTESPAPRVQQPPKQLDELLADFPGHENYTSSNDGLRNRSNGYARENIRVTEQSSRAQELNATPKTPTKNIAGPAVYYPPGNEMFTKKDESLAYQQAGGGQMKAARGKYMYESESGSKSKSSSKVTAVPVCLPLCCAMPCTIL